MVSLPPRGKMPALDKVLYSETRLGAKGSYYGTSPGGLDQTTPTLNLQTGALRGVVNYECSQAGGYARIVGYERCDGRPSPSSGVFSYVEFSSFVNTPVAGQTLTQAVSGATGVVVAVSIATASSPPYAIVTKVSGAFDITHNILVGATLIGTATSPTAGLTAKQSAIYLAATADVYRVDIGKVPGSGDILGVVGSALTGTNVIYAFRANVGATAVDIYKSSAAGWVNIPFYKIVEFTAGGTATPLDGAILTQGGVTATVKRVMTRTGPLIWNGTDAGAFVITTPAGGNFAAGAATLTGGATVTLSGAQTTISLAVGGKFQFDKFNFGGGNSTKRIYGCDGVNKGFDFDGDVLSPITTGNSPDAPKFVKAHKSSLFWGQGPTMTYSSPGFPYRYGAIDNAGQIAAGDDVTGMNTMPGDPNTAALAVFQLSNTGILYGTSIVDYNFVSFNTGVGCMPYAVQSLFDTFAFDTLGIYSLKTTINYGNFLPSTLTKNILPFIQQERTKITTSCVSFEKSQYRVFFSDGYGLWLTMVNSNYLGAGVVNFPDPVLCVDAADMVDGSHAIYFGSSSGYVFQMEMGTSFDGAEIPAYITLAWDPQKTPRVLKKYRAASVELQGNAYAEIQFGYSLGYGSLEIGTPSYTTAPSNFAGTAFWDQFTWDAFVWDGRQLFPTDVSMEGRAENVQVTIATTTNYIASFNVNSIIYHYSMGRGKRV